MDNVWKFLFKQYRAIQKSESPKSNILPNLCKFCAKGHKKYKGNIIDIGKCATFDAEVTIRNAAKYLKDETLLANIKSCKFGNGLKFCSSESQIPSCMQTRVFKQSERRKNPEKSNLSSEKKAKFAALNELIAFVNKHVIEKNTPTEVSQLLERYKREYINEGRKQGKIKSYTNQRLVNTLR